MTSTVRVLVAEDDVFLRPLLVRALGAAGYQVRAAASGDALRAEVADEAGPAARHLDLLVSDVGLPGPSGLEVLRELRSRGSTLPAVLMTGAPTGPLERETQALGARFLRKPFELSELFAAVDAALAVTARRPA